MRVTGAMQRLIAPSGLTPELTHNNAENAYKEFVQATEIVYGEMMHASVKVEGAGYRFFYENLGQVGTPGFRSLEILQRERLLETERLKSSESKVEAAYFNLTFLGVSFVLDCSPDASRMAARRANPNSIRRSCGASQSR
jgi:hypothetical protein